MGSVIHLKKVHYPESDGKPMGETDYHRAAMVQHIEVLEDYYQGQRVYVSGNVLVYYEQGNPSKYIVPDAFVVKGIAPKPRRTYKIWVERKSPDVVIETTSRTTQRKDTVRNPSLYAQLGVKEYFVFDPEQDYLDPPLQGYRLEGGDYVEIAPDPAGCLEARELGLKLCIEDGGLRFHRLDTGEPLLTRSERIRREAERADREAERADRETERADREAEARDAAERELARLRKSLSRRKKA